MNAGIRKFLEDLAAGRTMPSDAAMRARAILESRSKRPGAPAVWQWRRKGTPWTQEHTYFNEVHATTDDSEVRMLFEASPVPLQVWIGDMPESNGRTNHTAILHRGELHEGYTIARSQYPGRVQYEADRVRFLIGELATEPDILAYDSDKRTQCHLCGGTGEKNGKPCWGLNFEGTVHDHMPKAGGAA